MQRATITEEQHSTLFGANVLVGGILSVQKEPQRLKSYFLKGYSLVLELTLPITVLAILYGNCGPARAEVASQGERILHSCPDDFGFCVDQPSQMATKDRIGWVGPPGGLANWVPLRKV